MSSQYIHLDFVIIDGYPTQSRRSQELMTSVARSHASRVMHLKKTKPEHRRYRDEEEAREQIEKAARIRACQQGRSALSPVLAHVPYTVNYYISGPIPNTKPVFDIFQVKAFWYDHWLRCLSQEPYYSACSANLQLIRDSSTDPHLRTPSVPFLQHRLRAIQTLRQSFANGLHADDSTLLGMITLGFVAAKLGDCSQYDLHRRAVRKLVRDHRGIEVMNSSVTALVSAYDVYRSMQVAVPPLPGPQIYGPLLIGTLLTEIAPSLVEDLPPGFWKLTRNGKLPLELVRVLHRTNRFLHDRHDQPSTPTRTLPGEVSNNPSQPRLHSGFWAACPSLLARPTMGHEEPEISNLLSLGLWLYVALEFSSYSVYETLQHWTSMAHWLRHDLTKKLCKCVQIRSDDEEKCLIWLTRIAIECWRGPNQDLLPPGSTLNWFRKRRFVWPFNPDEGFFMFTKGSELD